MGLFSKSLSHFEMDGYQVEVIVKESNKHLYLRLKEGNLITVTTPIVLSQAQVKKHVKDFINKHKEKNFVNPSSELGNYFEYKGYSISLDRKSRNKNVYAKLREDGGIAVTGPFHTPDDIVYALLDKLIDKIDNKVDIEKVKKTNFKDNDVIYLLGHSYHVKIIEGKGKEFVDVDEVSRHVNVFVKDVNNQERIDILINNYIQQLANNIFIPRFNEIVKQFNHIDFIPQLKIRRMKTKYGVCYYKRNLVVLSTMLVHYDTHCIDYVIIHELSHFIHPNHSKKFYYLIEQYMPSYKEAEKKLKNIID